MQDPAREIFLEVSRRLNDEIRALSAALKEGSVPADLLESARRTSASGLSRLRAIEGGDAGLGATAAKVAEHLDLFAEVAASVGTAPELAGKLLEHLLEEQVEITDAEAARKSAVPGPRAAAAAPAPASRNELLPGGRRPLSVGSLIGR